MNLRRLASGLLLFVCFAQLASAASTTVVISQVYGGGGNSGATFKNDFIELHNIGSTSVNVSTWSVRYASSTGTTWQQTNLTGSIAPGAYYLVQEAAGAGGTTALPTPEATGGINMSATTGKVALVNNQTAFGTGVACPTGIVDFVGFGTAANCFEGSAAAPTLSNTTAAIRNGCIDTDNNAADFSSAAPNPHNSASTPTCGGTVTIPAAPTGVSAAAGDQQVTISWTASSGATSYRIRSSTTAGGPYSDAGSTTSTSFTNSGLTNGLTYYFVVVASNSAGDSGPSSEVNATPQPPVITTAAHIYFIDIGQGASTLIVGPTGKTLLVDGGPDTSGTAVLNMLAALHINSLDYALLTHYHIDHDSGLTAVLNAGKLGAAGIAYDNGDTPAASVQPPNLTGSTGAAYTAWVQAAGAKRQTITPGTVIDLGGGMRATCLAAGGRLLGGGSVPISNIDLNSESISLLIEYNDFDFLISGDLTGGGETSTANTPDVETFAGQLAGDVDIVQLDHHGSTTASNQRFLSTIKAEVAVAQAGSTNTFGHPNRETVNKFLNTADSAGDVFTGQAIPPFNGHGTIFYQMESPVSGDSRVTQQAWIASPVAGQGTIEVDTDGTTTYTVHSFVGNTFTHTYPVDGQSQGITTTFAPTVIPSIAPAVPLASDPVAVNAQVAPLPTNVTLTYATNGGTPTTQTMSFTGGVWTSTIPPQGDGTRVDYTVTATANGKTTSYRNGYFSGTTSVATLRNPSNYNSLGEPNCLGYPVRVQGTIVAGTGIYNSGANNDDYLQDATGGINIWRTTDPSSPAMQSTTTGESDSITGLIGNGSGRLRVELTPPFASPTTPFLVTQLAPGGTSPAPAAHTLAEIAANPEGLEGTLVSIANCHVTSGSIPGSASNDAFLTVTDGTTSFTMKVDKDTDLPGASTPSGNFTLIGTVQQDANLRPFIGSYDIAPRGRADIGIAPGTSPAISIAAARIDAVDNSDGTPVPDFIPDLLNQNVHIRGVVTTINFRPTGTEYYIQDDTAGVDVFSSATVLGNFPIGTYLDVVGSVTQFNGLTEINVGSNFRAITVVPNGPPIPAPQLITLSQLGEGVEGKLVTVNNVSAPAGNWPSNNNVTVTDATGAAQIRIVTATGINGTPIPNVQFNVTGVVGQFDSTAPFNSGYQIFPRGLADIVPVLSASPYSGGIVTLGQSSTSSITVTNNGASTITLGGITITGAGASAFTATAASTTTVTQGSSATIDITFAPTTTGAKSATLSISSSAGTIAVALNGQGVCGTIALSSAPGGVYGDAYAASVTGSGGVSPYTFTLNGGTLPAGVSLASDGSLSGTLTAAGTFAFTVQATDSYQCSGSQPFNVVIDRRALGAKANDASHVYGGANPAFTGSFTGAVASDNLSVSFTTSATNATPVGTYAITPQVNDPNNRLGNYNVTLTNGTLTITPAPLTIAAVSTSRPYGSANPAFDVTYSGFVLGETAANLGGTLIVGSSAAPDSPAGTYPIVASGLTSTNYAIAFAPGTLTVIPVTLHVRAGDQSIVFGDPLPPFTATITGFVLDETGAIVTGAPAFSTTATASSLPGDYVITVAQGTLAAPNYTFDFTPGTLHIGGITESLQSLIADLGSLPPSVKRDDAIKHLTNAIAPNLWIDSIHPRSTNVFTETKGAAIDLVFLQLQSELSRLVADDRMLALTAINDAVARSGNAKFIDQARGELAKGDDDVASQQFESGLEHYRNAWAKAGGA